MADSFMAKGSNWLLPGENQARGGGEGQQGQEWVRALPGHQAQINGERRSGGKGRDP